MLVNVERVRESQGMAAELSWCPRSHFSMLAPSPASRPAQMGQHGLLRGGCKAGGNVATDLVGYYRELIQCGGAGMTQKVPVGRLDGWAWRLALCAEQKQGSM